MDNDHGITGELREWAKKLAHWWYDPVKDEYTYTTSTMSPSLDAVRLDERILAIADRIDAEHERRMAGVMVDKMAERGWIRLHKGVDGEYIREGDKVEWRSHDGVWQKATTVAAVCGDGCYINLGGLVVHVSKFDIRRYHEPTVEDVLREFGKAWTDWLDGSPYDPIAEYAKRFKLAGDAE